jgi:hypothetical protein
MGLQPNRLLAEANGGALKILAIPKQAKPGERVTVTVQTIPHARCKIEAQGTPVTEALTLLQPMDADHLGNAKWTFEISKNYRADKLPIIVTSSKGSNVVDEKVVTTISISSNASPEQVELKLESKPKRATPGQYVTVSVAATPGAKLKIEAQDAGITQVMALADKTADKTGKASWTFRISETYKADKVPVIITEKWKDGDKKIISTIPIDRRM